MLEVRGVSGPEEERAVLDLLPTVMGAPREFFAARYRHDPHGSPGHSRIVVRDGAIVSHVRIYRRPMRLGWGEVWTGAIGDVCTLPDHRRQGHAARALGDAASWLTRQGIPLCTILSGVGVYERVGWEKLAEPLYTFPAAHLATVPPPPGVTVRRISRVEDEPALAAVYAAHAECRGLTVVRSHRYWRAHWDMALVERADACLLAERGGRCVAYMRCAGEGTSVSILEAPHLPDEEDAVAALAEALGRLAAKRGITSVSGYLPEDHPMHRLVAHEAAETPYLLVRVLDLAAVLREGLRGTVPPTGAPAGWTVRCAGQTAAVLSAGDRWAVAGGAAGGDLALDVGQAGLMRGLFRQAPPRVAWGPEWGWLDPVLTGRAPVYWRTDAV